MALLRVLPDTNVCYPISLLDLLLRLDEASLHEVIWTEDLLGELARTWVERGARSREAAVRICDDVRAAFIGQDVPRTDYEHLIASMPGQDPDDRVHAAAAVVRGRARSSPGTSETSRPGRWLSMASASSVRTTT